MCPFLCALNIVYLQNYEGNYQLAETEADYAKQWRLHTLIRIEINQSKKGCKDQESIQSSTTPDPGYKGESDKLTVRHHKRDPIGQPFPSR